MSLSNFNLQLHQAIEICRKHGLDSPSKITRFSKGMINDVFSLDDKYVIKIETGELQTPRTHKEKAILDMLWKEGIACPQTYAVDDSKEVIPYSFILMEHVPGATLSEVMPTLRTERKNDLLQKIGRTLGKIHSIQFSCFGDFFSEGTFCGQTQYANYMTERITALETALLQSRVLPETTIKDVARYFRHVDASNQPIKGSLIHGNFVPDNILIHQGDVRAVVDLEFAHAGRSDEEVAIFLYRTLQMDPDACKHFLAGYKAVHSLDSEFKKKVYAYNLLYYLKVLPSVPQWTHRPDKQKEYVDQTKELIARVLK